MALIGVHARGLCEPTAAKAGWNVPSLHARRQVSAPQHFSICSASATTDPATKPVNVSFSTHYQAAFGDKLKLVGNHEAAGSWDLDDAPDMTWHDGNVWTANLEVPTGTELEYKVVHVHPYGVRWESIDNRVLTISAAADMPQQGPRDSPVASSTDVSVLDASNGTEQVGFLTAMEVVCAWDHPAPLEIGINVDPQAETTEPVSPNADATANGSSTSQLESSESSSEGRPDGTSLQQDNASSGVLLAADSSSLHLSMPEASSKGLLHEDDPEQLSHPASMQAAETQDSDAGLSSARASLPQDLTAASLQQTAASDQEPGWQQPAENDDRNDFAGPEPAASSPDLHKVAEATSLSAGDQEQLENRAKDTSQEQLSTAEGAHGELQQAQSVQEAAPAQAPEKEQQVPKPDEDLTGQPSLSPESPEQPQQIEPGVQLTEQPGAPGELPTYLYSFDEQQNMQPFVETESEDEMDTSAALKTDALEGEQATAAAGASTSSGADLHLAQQRASLRPVRMHPPEASGDMSALTAVKGNTSPKEHPLPKPAEDSRPAKSAASAEPQPKQIGSVGQLAGVAAMGLAAGLAVAGASELADAAVISTLIAVGAAVLPSKTSLDENGQTIKRSIQGKGAGDVALGALAVGLNAAEGIARTFGLSSKQDMADADEEADLEYNAEDEDDADWEVEEEEWESPAEALMSATDQLAVSIMEAQGMESGNLQEAEAFAAAFRYPEHPE